MTTVLSLIKFSSNDWLKNFNVQLVLELLLSSLKTGYQSLQKLTAGTLVVESIWMSISASVLGNVRFLFDCLMSDSSNTYPDTVSKILSIYIEELKAYWTTELCLVLQLKTVIFTVKVLIFKNVLAL